MKIRESLKAAKEYKSQLLLSQEAKIVMMY